MSVRRTLTDYIALGNETLDVEFKSWMDLSDGLARAKIAKHIAALSNHGGGYLVFGVDDGTRQPQGVGPFPLETFSQDAIAGIVQRYLDPPMQITVDTADHEGVEYPVVGVEAHGRRPVVAKANGPVPAEDPKKGPQGILKGRVYIRSPKPESVEISSPDEWDALLDRCLRHRADLLGSIFRQSLERQAKPTLAGEKMLKAAIADTCTDFQVQVEALAALVPESDTENHEAVLNAKTAFAAIGYLLLDEDGAPVKLEELRELIQNTDRYMHQYAYYGWNSFLPLSPLERAPQIRTAVIDEDEVEYLEGMRLENTGLLSMSYDYWRLYELGMGITVESYAEDASSQRTTSGTPYLRLRWVLVRLHSVLVHARFLGAKVGGVHQVMVRMDWRDLAGRRLQRDPSRFVSPETLATDRYAKTLTLPWTDLIDDYFGCLRRLSLQLFKIFPSEGWRDPEDWLTREFVEQEFGKSDVGGLRLPD